MSRRERQRRRRRSRGGPARIVFLALGVLTASIAIGGLSFVGYIVSIANSGPSLSDLKPKDQGSNSIVYAADGTRLGVIAADTLRQPISSRLMPRAVRQATVAIEDKRFYKHGGVDFEGVIRAAIKNFQSHATVQGGSTLTMQLIKNLYTDDRKKDYKRKIREAKLAEELENVHPGKAGKEWILTKYLNNVPYGTVGGQTAYGVQAAARVFFNKRARDLTLPESALLAGLPQAPTSYNPFLHPALARQRRHEVLTQMESAGYITPEEMASADAASLGTEQTTFYRSRREAYFFDYVRKQLVKKYGAKTVSQGGLRVYTTINLRDQRLARAAIAKSLGQPGDPSAALVSIDPKNGWIKAMASSSKYADSKFNLAAQAERQPGSTFKMIVLMTALRRNIDINRTSYVSHKLDFLWHGTKIDVNTDDGRPSGKPKSLFEAVVSSDNTVFQQLDLDLGPENVTKTAHDMGITTHLDSYPAEALGGARRCCTPLEMTRAYVTINSGGYRRDPIAITKVVFPDGKVDTSLGKPHSVKVFTDGQTGEAIKAMEANVQRGTGTRAQLSGCTAAGKTGTTSGFKDAWFNGMTPHLNTAVWVGFAKANTPMLGVPGWPGEMFGGNAPAQIWHDFMASVVDPKTCGAFPTPKQPFVAEPFFGDLAQKAADFTDTTTTTTPTTTTPNPQANGQGTGKGGATYSPDTYQAPAQGTPPVGVPQVGTPGNGNGNGGGNGGGNGNAGGQGVGNGGGGAAPGN